MDRMRIGLAVILAVTCCGYAQDASRYALEDRGTFDAADRVQVTVEIRDVAEPGKRLPVRAIVTAADGSHADGSGHGLYADGRFYADGEFEVVVPAGQTRIELRSGPYYVPLVIEENLAAGRAYHVAAKLFHWFAPEAHGWYGGDNHVHALHDAHATVRASLRYTALQGRANGLNWITEAGSNVPTTTSTGWTRISFSYATRRSSDPAPTWGTSTRPVSLSRCRKRHWRHYRIGPCPSRRSKGKHTNLAVSRFIRIPCRRHTSCTGWGRRSFSPMP